jgi:hypothetical protein
MAADGTTRAGRQLGCTALHQRGGELVADGLFAVGRSREMSMHAHEGPVEIEIRCDAARW